MRTKTGKRPMIQTSVKLCCDYSGNSDYLMRQPLTVDHRRIISRYSRVEIIRRQRTNTRLYLTTVLNFVTV